MTTTNDTMDETRSSTSFDEWALLELMGHRRFAGRVREVQIGGASFLRIDVPSEPPATQFYSPSAVYCITPTTEDMCRAFSKRAAPEPISRWDLPALPPTTAETSDDEEPVAF